MRYVAGYIPRKLKTKIGRSAHPLKEQLNVCLEDILDDEEDLNDVDDSTEWVNAVDRGGLVHFSSATYHVLLTIELEVRKHLNVA